MKAQTGRLQASGWICVALAVITAALYLPALRHEFLVYDDQQYVTENPHVQAGLTARGIAWAFGFLAGNWHPLAWLSHILDCQLYGLNPAGHHLTSLLLHVANTVLVFLVLQSLTRATWRSASVAALFGWHPLHVESVAWIAERKDVLCAFFWLLTLLAYARYAEESRVQSPKSKVWYVAALIAFALALMSKPMAVTLPGVLLLLDLWPLGRLSDPATRNAQLRHVLLEKIPFFVLSAAVCALTLRAQQVAMVSSAGLPVPERLAHAAAAYAHYAGSMFAPWGLAVFYPYRVELPTDQLLLSGAFLGAVTVLAVRWGKQRPWLGVGWFWFLGTLVPVIGLVQVGDQAWADRYTYLPLIGLFLVTAWAATELIANRKLLTALAGAVFVALLAMTSLQLRHWQNTRTLFEHAERVTRENHVAITLLGSLLAQEGRLDAAIERYHTALRLKPDYPQAHFFLGNAFDQQGKLDAAIAEYEKALWFTPLRGPTHLLLGAALAKLNRPEEAATHYLAALKLDPDSALVHNNLARLRHTQGRLDQAIEHYTAAVQLDPKLAPAHNNLGILLLQQGRLAEGTDELRSALRLNPTNAESQLNLALALNQQEQWAEAAMLFAKAVGANSVDPTAHFQFGLALAHTQRTREAMGEFARALLLRPDFPDALDRLSWILATDSQAEIRNGAEAVRMAERACELTTRKDPVKLQTLAAAYAEVGRFSGAVAVVQEALAKTGPADRKELARDLAAMLESFKANQPWRTAKP